MLANAADRSELVASMRNAPNNGRLGQSEIWQILAKWIFMTIPPTGRERGSPCNYWLKLAGATGLEPATSCVTGRRSNQLNYAPANSLKMISRALHSLAVSCTAFHVLRRDRASFST